MNEPPILEFRKVSKSFGNIKVLEDVSFSVAKGEFVFLVGLSGAGKTTILKLLLGEFPPTSGQIIFDGQEVNKLSSKMLPYYRREIGVVFQDFRLLSERTVRENIEVVLSFKGVPSAEWRERVDGVLKIVGLSKRSELFPSQLSGGEIQRTTLARALVLNPKLVFADEPTGNLDWETADAIMELLVKINKEGKTVMVTSHNKNIVEKLKKRVIELKEGRVV